MSSELLRDIKEGYNKMNERFVKTPWYWKVTGVITTSVLAACAVGEKIGFVTPHPEGTRVNPTETTPTPIPQEIRGQILQATPTPTATPTPEATAAQEPKATPEPTQTKTPTSEVPMETGPSLEFSPLFPAEWSKRFTGQVAGMDIPIIIGLSYGVVYDKVEPITPIKGVWMTREGTDAVADAFLRAAHYRYTKIMGNNVTYEEYLDILKQPSGGEVNLLVLDEDGKTRREAMINPRRGFSILMTDEEEMPVKTTPSAGIFLGVDGQGRLLFAANYFRLFHLNREYLINGVPTKDFSFIYDNLGGVMDFGWRKNKCMKNGDYWSTCGQVSVPPEMESWWQVLFNIENKAMASGTYELLFGLEKS